MSDIPEPSHFWGTERLWAVVAGKIKATFYDKADAEAYAAYLTEVDKSHSSHSTPYTVSEVPKPSKLTLAIEPVEARGSSGPEES